MARRKKEKKSVAMPYLPNDLIIEILLRLPVKYVLQFRCVSKFFCSLISHNPRFAISHFDLASASPSLTHHHRLLYLPTKAGYAFASNNSASIDLDDSDSDSDSDYDSSSLSLSSVAALDLSYLPPMSIPFIKGSCRGFILLFDIIHHFLVIWNPSTRAYKQLPSTDLLRCFVHTVFFGFGYDASKDDYLVVLGTRYIPGKSESDFTLFSLRANAWTTIEGTHLPYRSLTRGGRGALLNGVIHWLTFRYDIRQHVILAFDLMEKSFSEVPLPPGIDGKDANSNPWNAHPWDICVLGGSLCMYIPGDYATYIWVMKEYKVLSSWSKSVAFVMPFDAEREFILEKYPNPNQFFFPMYFTKSGDIVGTDGRTRVVKFNAKGQLLDQHSFRNLHGGFECEAVMYTESLLSFPLN